MNIYDEGDIVRMIVTFTDPATNLPVDPGTVTVAFAVAPNETGPLGTPTTYIYTGATAPAVGIVARTAPGVYEAQADSTSQPGWWTYRGVSTGTGQAAADGQLRVTAKPF